MFEYNYVGGFVDTDFSLFWKILSNLYDKRLLLSWERINKYLILSYLF
jgi:hypothetical protein